MKIAILAGETSGDNYASLLAESIRKIAPKAFILGTGGKKMKSVSNFFVDMPCGKMGFSDVIRNIGLFYVAYKRVVEAIEKERPSVVVFIDNPGFNLKVARAVGGRYSCIYYIPPKIWAHGYGRVETIRRYIKAVIPIFPFEEKLYRKEKIECRWFGHPAGDLVEDACRNREGRKVPLQPGASVIGFLPGSREEEVRNLVPEFVKIAKQLAMERKLEFLISASDDKIRQLEESLLAECGINDISIKEDLYEVISGSSLVFAASGTVNLEVALMERPSIVFYKTSFLNYRLARMLVKLKNVSPVNLMLEEKAVPEYIQFFPSDKIREDVFNILDKGDLYRKQAEGFSLIREKMGTGHVSGKVAEMVIDYSERKR